MTRLRIHGAAWALLLASPAAAGAAEEDLGAQLFSVNLGLSLWTVVIFLLLLGVLWKFAWGPILLAVNEREERIRARLDEAERQRDEATRLLEEHRKQLADARRQSQQILQEGRDAAEQVRRDLEQKARSEGEAILERARREIGREKDAALESLRAESVDLALAAASRLMQERMDREKDRELVLDYLKDLEGREARVPTSGGGGAEA